MNPRAIEYRKINKLSDAMGTAVNVQAMVFGNMGETSGTGVLFSRDPSTGKPGMMGEFLQNAQGEDVVAGIRTPLGAGQDDDLTCGEGDRAGRPGRDLHEQAGGVHQHEAGSACTRTWSTSSSPSSRASCSSCRAASASAALAPLSRSQSTWSNEEMIDQKTALGRLTADQFKVMRRPMIDPSFKEKPHLVGLPACPGVVTGRPVFSSEEAVKANDPVILVTHETNPDDIAGMAKAVGILTQTGGATSHAAVVARAMDKPCVVGCSQMELMDGMIGITGKLTNADVTIDGATGRVWVGVKVPVIDASEDPAIQTVMGWCMSDLGACELSPVGLGMDKPHRITAALSGGATSRCSTPSSPISKSCRAASISRSTCSTRTCSLKPTDAALLGAFGQAATSVYDDFSDTRAPAAGAAGGKAEGPGAGQYGSDDAAPGGAGELGYVMGVHPVQAGQKRSRRTTRPSQG